MRLPLLALAFTALAGPAGLEHYITSLIPAPASGAEPSSFGMLPVLVLLLFVVRHDFLPTRG